MNTYGYGYDTEGIIRDWICRGQPNDPPLFRTYKLYKIFRQVSLFRPVPFPTSFSRYFSKPPLYFSTSLFISSMALCDAFRQIFVEAPVKSYRLRILVSLIGRTRLSNQPASQPVSLKLPRLNPENLQCVKCVSVVEIFGREHSSSLLGNIPGNIPRSSCIILHPRIQGHLVMASHWTRYEMCRHHYRDCTSIHYGRKSNFDQRIRRRDCQSSHLWPCSRPISCHEATRP
jgi:hypothetical protein